MHTHTGTQAVPQLLFKQPLPTLTAIPEFCTAPGGPRTSPEPGSSPTVVEWQKGKRIPPLRHGVSSKTLLTAGATGCSVSSSFLPGCSVYIPPNIHGRGAFSLTPVECILLLTFYWTLPPDRSACPSGHVIPGLTVQWKSAAQATRKGVRSPAERGGSHRRALLTAQLVNHSNSHRKSFTESLWMAFILQVWNIPNSLVKNSDLCYSDKFFFLPFY